MNASYKPPPSRIYEASTLTCHLYRTIMTLSNLVSLPIQRILDKALSKIALSRLELLTLLSLDSNSSEADALRLVGKHLTQQRFGKKSMLLAQTGIESFPCPAKCSFCSFSQDTYTGGNWRIKDERLTQINTDIQKIQGAYSHFLLFMHTYDFSYMLRTIEQTRKELPTCTNVVINCGDIDAVQAEELRAAGASGAYHVLRLREGEDTRINPKERIKSIQALKTSKLDWYTCCEPVGPEHTNEEIVDNILFTAEYECFQNAVMRRINIPGGVMEARGQISLIRSAQIVAVMSIAMTHSTQLSSIAIHEPDLLGLSSGANCIYAEFEANPRDINDSNFQSRGYSLAHCQSILRDVGFTSLMQNKGHKDILL